ncbi:MAG: hypothetical protein B7Z80_19400 [Rhodospirillales bacterium 20-64-7]|nr:MAG: hypothetical protein B7Z80_19400 [Rhodospirillales bacterium 20-64-7]HQT75983.1 hypothetical protein [Rhodopila sp.]
MRISVVPLAFIGSLVISGAFGAERYVAFNDTTSTVFTGVYLAPQGTGNWGPNQALNDKDKVWDYSERLTLRGVSHGLYDLKIVDRSGRACVKHGVDLRKDTTFDIRDADLQDCKP